MTTCTSPVRPRSCPSSPLVADLDARAIVRLIWPHLLEAHLAGVQPFTLEPIS